MHQEAQVSLHSKAGRRGISHLGHSAGDEGSHAFHQQAPNRMPAPPGKCPWSHGSSLASRQLGHQRHRQSLAPSNRSITYCHRAPPARARTWNEQQERAGGGGAHPHGVCTSSRHVFYVCFIYAKYSGLAESLEGLRDTPCPHLGGAVARADVSTLLHSHLCTQRGATGKTDCKGAAAGCITQH